MTKVYTFARVHVTKRMRGCSRVAGLVEGQIATAMSLARLLSSIPPLGEGPAKVLIYDIHALGERYRWPNITASAVSNALTAALYHYHLP